MCFLQGYLGFIVYPYTYYTILDYLIQPYDLQPIHISQQNVAVLLETVCLKCGDRGFSETLVFCTECQAYALHRYLLSTPSLCLRGCIYGKYCLKGPVILTGDVTWFCEDCATKLGVPPSLDQSTPLSFETRDSVNLENNAIQATRQLKNCRERVKKRNEQRKKKIKKKQKKGKVNSHLVANSDVGFKFVPVSQGATHDDLSCVELDGHIDALPIFDPIWRGSMYFCNETIGTVSGLLAHLSNLACTKVVEETEHFLEVLHVELLPISMVWPESFKSGRRPTVRDIALFFFPDSEGAEKVFDALVHDIICLEHAIRFVTKNAELLIFPSTELPIHYWRFEAKYYLWGVFRRKQTSDKTNHAVHIQNRWKMRRGKGRGLLCEHEEMGWEGREKS
ncbi:hypothetical protein CR513_35820, partial [Mucuna pruriens]